MKTKSRILIVDDEAPMLSMIRMVLEPCYDVVTAPGAEEALIALAQGEPFAVALSDHEMKGITGTEFLAAVKERSPDTTRMMLTGNHERTTAMEAVNQGNIFRFLLKPFQRASLLQSVEEGVQQHRLVAAEKQLLTQTVNGAIQVLADVLSVAAPESFGRSRAVQEKMRTMAAHLKLEDVWELEAAALLARIGEMSIPPDVLAKARTGLTLSPLESQMLLRVPEFGHKLVAHIPRLENVARHILYQAKHFDGSGFPADLVAGSALPLGARLLCVLEAMTAHESNGLPPAAALCAMEKSAYRYDPKIMVAAQACFAAPASEEKAEVTLKELVIGARVAEAVMTRGGLSIVAAHTVITQSILQRLRNFAEVGELREPIVIYGPNSA